MTASSNHSTLSALFRYPASWDTCVLSYKKTPISLKIQPFPDRQNRFMTLKDWEKAQRLSYAFFRKTNRFSDFYCIVS